MGDHWDQREDLHRIERGETPEERARRLGVPLVPRRPRPGPVPHDFVVAVCGECGLKLRRTMHYSCRNADCPTGLGPLASIHSISLRDSDNTARITWEIGGVRSTSA